MLGVYNHKDYNHKDNDFRDGHDKSPISNFIDLDLK